MATKVIQPFNGAALLKAVQLGTASPAELRQALDLTEAIQASSSGDVSPEQVAILKAADLIEDDETPELEVEDPAEESEPLEVPVKKAVDLPSPTAIEDALAATGQTLDVSPVLQASNEAYVRLAKAMEIQNDLLDETNALLVRMAERADADHTTLRTVQKSVDVLAGQFTGLGGAGDAEGFVLKSLHTSIAAGLEEALGGIGRRVADVERVLHTHPSSPHPRSGARGVPVLKGLQNGLTADGDLSYPAAITLVQKAVNVEKMDRMTILNDLQTAHEEGLPLTSVFQRWNLPVAQ